MEGRPVCCVDFFHAGLFIPFVICNNNFIDLLKLNFDCFDNIFKISATHLVVYVKGLSNCKFTNNTCVNFHC